jgi:poly-gamma-glutamate synthesis protein (capsule biosynthesis protein)
LLRAAGLGCAGTGASLSAARAPAYAHGARASSSLVAWTSTFERDTPAADAQGLFAARPGASTLGLTPIALVSAAQLAALRAIRDAQPAASRPAVMTEFDERLGLVTLFGQHYAAHPPGSPADAPVRLHHRMDEQDRESLLLHIRQASRARTSRWPPRTPTSPTTGRPPRPTSCRRWRARPSTAAPTCSSATARTSCAASRSTRASPSSIRWATSLHRAAAAAARRMGAPAVAPAAGRARARPQAKHGRRVHGMGARGRRLGESLWFESVIALSRYGAHGRLRELELVPIELNWDGRHAHRGIPRLAPREQGLRILQRLAGLSAPLGTHIEIDTATARGRIAGEARPRRAEPRAGDDPAASALNPGPPAPCCRSSPGSSPPGC